MQSNEIVNNILSSINIIADNKVKKSANNISILAEVINIDKKIEGEYVVKYGNIEITVYSDSGVYSIGDKVYVIIPNGDFTNTKFILGKQR